MINLIIVHLFGLMTPGPDFFYVSRMAASNSKRNTVSAILGITFGVGVWALAAMLGLAILFATMPILHGSIMILGGGYLMYIGFLMAKTRTNAIFEPVSDTEINRQTSVKQELVKGLFVNLSNAKAIIYFASVMSFVLAKLTSPMQMVVAFAVILIETFVYFYVISLLFSHPFAKRFYSQYSRYIDNAAGIIFLAFGGYLVYSGVGEIHL